MNGIQFQDDSLSTFSHNHIILFTFQASFGMDAAQLSLTGKVFNQLMSLKDLDIIGWCMRLWSQLPICRRMIIVNQIMNEIFGFSLQLRIDLLLTTTKTTIILWLMVHRTSIFFQPFLLFYVFFFVELLFFTYFIS